MGGGRDEGKGCSEAKSEVAPESIGKVNGCHREVVLIRSFPLSCLGDFTALLLLVCYIWDDSVAKISDQLLPQFSWGSIGCEKVSLQKRMFLPLILSTNRKKEVFLPHEN